MRVGNLQAQRDFTDVRDVARAYQLLAEKGQPGQAYFICSGKAVSIQFLLDTLIEASGVNVEIEYDPARMRPSDTPCLGGIEFSNIAKHSLAFLRRGQRNDIRKRIRRVSRLGRAEIGWRFFLEETVDRVGERWVGDAKRKSAKLECPPADNPIHGG